MSQCDQLSAVQSRNWKIDDARTSKNLKILYRPPSGIDEDLHNQFRLFLQSLFKVVKCEVSEESVVRLCLEQSIGDWV